MNNSKTNKRLFNIKDVYLLGETKIIFDLFVKDKADFIAFDPDFGGNFEQGWEQQIKAAGYLSPNHTIMTQMRQTTEKVEQVMEQCKTKFKQSKYFIEKAFPNKSMQLEFGYQDYYSSSRSQEKMIQFMKEFHAVAVKYQQELLAVGYTQAMIDEINALQQQLDEANKEQELFRRNRGNLTQERITKFNAVWKILTKVCKAGKIIYADNAVKYKQYLLPKRRKRKKDDEKQIED